VSSSSATFTLWSPVDVEGLSALVKNVFENNRKLVHPRVQEARDENESAAKKLVGALLHVLIQVSVHHDTGKVRSVARTQELRAPARRNASLFKNPRRGRRTEATSHSR
jgi:hypothetical protein